MYYITSTTDQIIEVQFLCWKQEDLLKKDTIILSFWESKINKDKQTKTNSLTIAWPTVL